MIWLKVLRAVFVPKDMPWRKAISHEFSMLEMPVAIRFLLKESGWDKFLDAESTVPLDLLKPNKVIVDTGKGVIERPNNIKNLRESGLVFWLKASICLANGERLKFV